ncbi:hypothetical protein Tco_0805589 [Tanacetum coccineum]
MVKGRVIKSRIDTVYDDAGNSFHGTKMAKKFMDHFQIFFGTCDVVYPMEEPDSLFTKKLDAEVAMNLIRPVSDEEIKIALFDIDDNKASGPDGYSCKFFKAAWKVVGDDTCATIKEFFRNGKLLGEFNAFIISLIPKSVSPRKVVDYRPISCCNVVYKAISKIINNRLKMVLKDLPHGFFKVGRGLRQGDPISPYLFTLVMEVLNLIVMRHVKAEKGFKYHRGYKELKVFSTWMAFGGNTHDLGSFGEETDEITDLHQIHEEILFSECGGGVVGIRRRRRDQYSDGARDLVTASGRGRLNEDL